MKTCFKCGEAKPYSEFYKHSEMGDGYLGKCKDCTKADTAARIAEKMKDPNWVVAEAARSRARANKNRIVVSPERKRVIQANYRMGHPGKYIANNAVNNAVRDGRIVRKPCEVCGSLDSEAHHEDYSKPLDVIWLCPKHHAERHVQMRDEIRRKRAIEKQSAAA